MLRRSQLPWTAAGPSSGDLKNMLLTSGNKTSFKYSNSPGIIYREKEMITPEQHKKMFILHGTMETQPAEDNKASFTQILSSVCKENGGAVDILKIEE